MQISICKEQDEDIIFGMKWLAPQRKENNMNLPAVFKSFTSNYLVDPGDLFTAKITKSGRQVIKLHKRGTKKSAVRYPTGTIVETSVYRLD